MKSDKLFFGSIQYRYDIRVYFSIRYNINTILGPQKAFFLRNFLAIFWNFRRFFRIFGVFVVEDFGSWVFGIFGEFSEFSENFRRKKDKKITGFENIEILDMGGSIRYTLRYTEKSDISAFDNFSIQYAHP